MEFKKLSLALLLAAGATRAGAQNVVPVFDLMNVVDNQMVSVRPCGDCAGVAAIFTSLRCPYDQHYQERIKKLYEKYAGKISFFLIDSNPGAEESEAKMKAAYADWNMTIPFLSDKSQVGVKAFNATRTPEVVLLKPEGNGLQIVYQGAIDDNPQVHHDTGKNFLDDAMAELVAGKPITIPAERVIGCTIRKNP